MWWMRTNFDPVIHCDINRLLYYNAFKSDLRPMGVPFHEIETEKGNSIAFFTNF